MKLSFILGKDLSNIRIPHSDACRIELYCLIWFTSSCPAVSVSSWAELVTTSVECRVDYNTTTIHIVNVSKFLVESTPLRNLRVLYRSRYIHHGINNSTVWYKYKNITHIMIVLPIIEKYVLYKKSSICSRKSFIPCAVPYKFHSERFFWATTCW